MAEDEDDDWGDFGEAPVLQSESEGEHSSSSVEWTTVIEPMVSTEDELESRRRNENLVLAKALEEARISESSQAAADILSTKEFFTSAGYTEVSSAMADETALAYWCVQRACDVIFGQSVAASHPNDLTRALAPSVRSIPIQSSEGPSAGSWARQFLRERAGDRAASPLPPPSAPTAAIHEEDEDIAAADIGEPAPEKLP